MGSVFKKPSKPKPDPKILAAQRAEEERVRKEKEKEDQMAANEAEARRLGLRGRKALFGSTSGFLSEEENSGTVIT